mgnify:CR=1 FL=1
MRRRMIAAVLAVLAGFPAAAWAQRPAELAIGTWMLACPPEATLRPCVLRHRDWLLPPAGPGTPTAALEVQGRNGTPVAVVTLRGLPTQAAIGGALVMRPTVSLKLDAGPAVPLTCTLASGTYVCAPSFADMPRLAAALPTAQAIEARIEIAVPGLAALPPQTRTLELGATIQALAAARHYGVENTTMPEIPGLDLFGFIDRVARAAGFRNGMGDLTRLNAP